MAEMIETIAHLSSEIGPRPAATEEEQQAALYLAEQFEATGLPTEVEEFTGPMSNKKTRVICAGVAIVATILALFLPVASIPAALIVLVCTVLCTLEELGKPVLSNILEKGVSQNVVAHYLPAGAQQGGRRRKIIVVARTDSGSVRPETNGPLLGALPVLAMASRVGIVVLALLVLVRTLFFPHATGVAFVVLLVLIIAAIICTALPIVSFIMSKVSGYNEGANSSAAGVAVMLEAARRVTGNASAPVMAVREPIVHGEAAAFAAGVVPEGAELVYETEANDDDIQIEMESFEAPAEQPLPEYDPEPQSEADRLLSAKAAIAALTGRPVSNTISMTLPDEAPAAQPEPEPEAVAAAVAVPAAVAAGVALGFAEDPAAAVAEGAEAVVEIPEYVAPVQERSVPAWFEAGRAAARRTGLVEQPLNVKRSTFNQALESAESRLGATAPEPVYEYVPIAEPAPISEIEDPRIPEADFAATPLTVTEEVVEESAEPEVQPEPQPVVESVLPERPVAPLVFESPSERKAREVQESSPVVVVQSSIVPDEPIAVPEVVVAPAPEPEPEPAVPELAPIPMDYFLAAAVESSAVADASQLQVAPVADANATVALPDLGATMAMPSIDLQQQRAPLAVAETSGQSTAKSLLSMLPSIDTSAPEQADLRSAIPSLSGSFARVSSPAAGSPSATGAFAPLAGATGTFAAVASNLEFEADDDEDLIVDDADDSAFDDASYTETGAYAGPGYVEMPKKRGLGLLDRLFGRSKKEEEVSTNEWLDVDDDFEARSVGQQRGSWESFREDDDQYDDYEDDYEDDFDDYYDAEDDFEDDDFDFDDDERWNGGAFSGVLAGAAEGISGAASKVRGALPKGKKEEPAEEPRESRRSRRSREEGYEPASPFGDLPLKYTTEPEEGFAASMAVEPEQEIYNFRASDLNTEVYFVALGADMDNHAGMTAFLAEHADELRGAVVLELDSLGAGELCMINKEGVLRKTSTSSRMRRYLTKASQASGVRAETAELLWNESASTTAAKAGVQAIHLAGMDGAKPALFAQADDIVDNIDEAILAENVNFVVEMLKTI